jgi:hypothetical protein
MTGSLKWQATVSGFRLHEHCCFLSNRFNGNHGCVFMRSWPLKPSSCVTSALSAASDINQNESTQGGMAATGYFRTPKFAENKYLVDQYRLTTTLGRFEIGRSCDRETSFPIQGPHFRDLAHLFVHEYLIVTHVSASQPRNKSNLK